MATWSKDTVQEFIQMYRSKECLWNVKSKDYSNRYVRDKAYDELLKFCKTFNAEADKSVVLKKISNLRASFLKEFKKREKSKRSGARPDEVYEPKLWYFKDLLFLRRRGQNNELAVTRPNGTEFPNARIKCEEHSESCSSRSGSPNGLEELLSPQSELAPESPCIESEEQHSQESLAQQATLVYSTSPKPVWKRKSLDDDFIKAARMRLLLNSSSADGKEDQHDAFGKNVAHKLRRLPREQRIYAEKIICNALCEAELGSLSGNSAIATVMPNNTLGK